MVSATDEWGSAMSDLDKGTSTTDSGTGGSGPEAGTTPFLSAPPSLGVKAPASAEASKPSAAGRHAQAATESPAPVSTPTSVPKQAPAPDAEAATQSPAASGAVVKGQITIEDEVVEKIAALAALEVEGIADLGGDVERVIESVRSRIGVGQRRGDQGVKAEIQNNEVTLDVVVVVEYGAIVMDVAKAVKGNVARVVSRMLGMRVTSVNVTVDDVHVPGPDPVPAALDAETESEDAAQPA
jgi:uncharacterized alkaline shock family protein YloU